MHKYTIAITIEFLLRHREAVSSR